MKETEAGLTSIITVLTDIYDIINILNVRWIQMSFHHGIYFNQI